MTIKLIAGLGNPGKEYEQTRHNAGFWLLDELAWQWKAPFKEEKKYFGHAARVTLPEYGDIWLLKPDTFMNLSGKAVGALAQFFKIKPEEILVVHDELDIPCGRIRFKRGGGNGGHNGLTDVQAKLDAGEKVVYTLNGVSKEFSLADTTQDMCLFVEVPDDVDSAFSLSEGDLIITYNADGD